MPRSREEDFLSNASNFTLFTPKLPPLGVGLGHKIYNFLFPYPTNDTYRIWSRFCPVVLEKKMLTDDARRTTTDDHGRQPIAIGHLNDSGYLKCLSFVFLNI